LAASASVNVVSSSGQLDVKPSGVSPSVCTRPRTNPEKSVPVAGLSIGLRGAVDSVKPGLTDAQSDTPNTMVSPALGPPIGGAVVRSGPPKWKPLTVTTGLLDA
jgi:hypothetical protein